MSRQVNEYYGKYSYEICVSSFLLLPLLPSFLPLTFLFLCLPLSLCLHFPTQESDKKTRATL